MDGVREENKKLKAQIDDREKLYRKSPGPPPIDELESLKSQLRRWKVEHGRVSTARNILETKCRYYKESLKEWKNYSRGYWKRNSDLYHEGDFKNATRRQISIGAVGELASELPPPIYARSTSFSSNPSRSVSPHHKMTQHDYIHAQSLQPHANKQAALMLTPKRNMQLTSEDLAETCDDSEVQEGIVHGIGKLEEGDPSSRSPKCKEEDTGGSSPVVVHERSLKRKARNKRGKSEKPCHEDAPAKPEPAKNFRVKDEQKEPPSSPLQPSRLLNQQGYTGDSLDLDEVGGTLYTPRKRQRLELMRRQSSKLAALDANFTNQHGDILDEDDFHNEISQQLALHHGHAQVSDENLDPIPLDSKGPGTHHDSDRQERQVDKQHREDNWHLAIEKRGDPLLVPDSRDQKIQDQAKYRDDMRNSVASPRSESSILPRTSSARATKPHRCPPSRRDRGAAYVPALAGDGGVGAISNGANRDLASDTNAKKTPEALNAHRRLGQLLKDPPPGRTSLSDGPNQTAAGNAVESPDLSRRNPPKNLAAHSTPQSLPATKKTRMPQATTSKSAQQSRAKRTTPLTYSRKKSLSDDGRGEVLPEHGPLRARPLHRLRLEDFKLNPNHSNYAYHETIRKHDEKKRRNGCTDPFCQRCKDLKKFVEMSGYSASKTTGLFDSSPSDGTSNVDDKLLREFLGSDAYRIPKMREREKQDLLLKAKTKQFTDRFGKHRQGFSKPPEPPGFWMTEFPSTQENERFAEEALIIERAKIEERREEALRRGTWLFADEV